MIDAVLSEHVNAPADRVQALYRDPANWAHLFPATIRGARVVRREGDTTVVEVDHVEGKVVNILRNISSTRIDLVEFKRRYEATFVNEFIPEGEGMRYMLTASVRLKWPYRLLSAPRVSRYIFVPSKIRCSERLIETASVALALNRKTMHPARRAHKMSDSVLAVR